MRPHIRVGRVFEFYMLSPKGNPSSRRQLFGVGALAHHGLLPVRGFVREVPLAFTALHLSAREGCAGHCGTLIPMAVFVENALVLLTRFFCAVARRWDLGDLSTQVKLTVNNFWRPLRLVSAAKSMVKKKAQSSPFAMKCVPGCRRCLMRRSRRSRTTFFDA